MRRLPIFLIAGGIAATALTGAATRSSKSDISRNVDIFTSIYKTLQTNYVDTIDADKSMNTAIAAMLDEIDPYTEYIPESAQDNFLTISTGEYGGIGAYIQERPGKGVIVSEPRKGTPSQLSGLKPGDLFLTIDGDTVTNAHSDEVSKKLRGQAGTTVKVTVKRPWTDDSILSFEITREKIEIDPVPYYGVHHGNIGYIQLTTFNEKSYDKTREALMALKENPAVESIVLDMRGNGGGLLESAVKIVGLFVPKGTEVVRTRGRGLLNEKVYKTTVNPVDTKIPLAVIVNGLSASSAEIVTGALQDLDRAVIVGERSYGKGLVQSTRQIPYNGLLKITTAKYYIPSGRLIQAIDYSRRNEDGSVARIPDSLTTVWHTLGGREVRDGGGITPDIAVELPESNRLLYTIMSELWAYDFANKYANNLAQAPSPDTWQVDDSVFNQFKRFIDPARFKYDRATEAGIKYLRDAARIEGYMSDSVDSAITHLENMMKHNLERDLDFNRKAISTILNSEMGNRWFSNADLIRRTLPDDKELKEAVNVLNDPRQYGVILSPKPKDEKTAKPAKPKK